MVSRSSLSCRPLILQQSLLLLPHFLASEFEMWSEQCQMEKGPLPSKLTDVLPFVDKVSFPNVYTTVRKPRWTKTKGEKIVLKERADCALQFAKSFSLELVSLTFRDTDTYQNN